jgi:acyl-coenzyme A synthetase/AMP-(fatty) acid ligase
VTDVGVIGVSDGQGNDLPRAYVVVSSSTKVSEDKIHAFLNSRVSPSKRLRGGIVFVAEVPRNLNGKIMRNVLQEWAKTDDPKARL